MKHPYITVIGNVASGKSTVSKLLAKKLNAKLIKADELYKTDPFFQIALRDRPRWTLISDLWFLEKRVAIAEKIEKMLNSTSIVQDSGLPMQWVYAQSRLESGFVSKDESILYNALSERLTRHLSAENQIIYLYEPLLVLKERIRKRGRKFEIKYHSDDYLLILERTLQKLIKIFQKKKIKVHTTSLNGLSKTIFEVQSISRQVQ